MKCPKLDLSYSSFRDEFGCTPLHYAAMGKADDCMELITEYAGNSYIGDLIAVQELSYVNVKRKPCYQLREVNS